MCSVFSVDLNRIGGAALQVIASPEFWQGNGGFNWDGNSAGLDRMGAVLLHVVVAWYAPAGPMS